MKCRILFLWIVLGASLCSLQNAIASQPEVAFLTDQFRLLTRPRDFALQFLSKGKTRQIQVPRDWLVPPEEEKAEEDSYVSSFLYDRQVTSFPIGNGKIGLQISSFAEQTEGSAHAAAGRDVFLVFDPGSSAVLRGGIERGVTKQRVRSMGCFSAKAERYYLTDVDGDGLTDIGVVQEEIQCVEKSDEPVERIVGPFYKQYPVAWYVFKENGWKLEENQSGKFPEHYMELPLIGIKLSPVDVVGFNLWRTCDRTKWLTGENDQHSRQN